MAMTLPTLPTLQALHDELRQLARAGHLTAEETRRRGTPMIEAGRDIARVRWPGAGTFWLDSEQRRVVELLAEAYLQAGTPEVDQGVLLRAVGSKARRLAYVFTGSDAWGRLILPGQRAGNYRLAEMPEAPEEPRVYVEPEE